MEGFEVGERFDTMGLRGNDLRRLYFKDVRVPAENVLGEPGEGFRVAMQILNNGRIGLGTGSVGAAKKLLDLTIDHVKERAPVRPAARRLRAGPGQDRLDGLLPVRAGGDGLPHLRAGRRRRPRLLARVGDLQGLRDRVPLVRGQPLAAARGRRAATCATSPTRRSCATSGSSRSSRAPTTCMRAFIALGRAQAGRREARGPRRRRPRATRSARSACSSTTSADRVQREVRPDKITKAHEELDRHADAVSRQVEAARDGHRGSCCASTRREIIERQFQQKRARRRRRRHLRPDRGALPRHRDLRGPGRRALGPGALHRRHLLHARRRRVDAPTSSRSSQNDDERMTAIAKLAYKRGEYGYALFED